MDQPVYTWCTTRYESWSLDVFCKDEDLLDDDTTIFLNILSVDDTIMLQLDVKNNSKMVEGMQLFVYGSKDKCAISIPSQGYIYLSATLVGLMILSFDAPLFNPLPLLEKHSEETLIYISLMIKTFANYHSWFE